MMMERSPLASFEALLVRAGVLGGGTTGQVTMMPLTKLNPAYGTQSPDGAGGSALHEVHVGSCPHIAPWMMPLE